MSQCLRRAESCENRGSGDGSAERRSVGRRTNPCRTDTSAENSWLWFLQVMAGQKRVFALDVPAIHVFGRGEVKMRLRGTRSRDRNPDNTRTHSAPHLRTASVAPSGVASKTGEASTAWM